MEMNRISEFLGQLGWPQQAMTDAVLTAEYKGAFGITKVLFHAHEAGLRIAINPVLEKSEQSGWSRSVNKLIASLDRESHGVRIGFDKAGDIYVKVDLPEQELNFEQFVYVLLNVCQISEQLTVPVLQAQAYDRKIAVA
ncbi:MAG: hypothetical protein WCK49_08315 [Myxococcaceae bacterium]